MKLIEYLNEAKQVGVIYHFTSNLEVLNNILKSLIHIQQNLLKFFLMMVKMGEVLQ